MEGPYRCVEVNCLLPACLLWRVLQHSSLQLITPPAAVKSAFEDALAAGLYHLIVQSIVPRSNV